MRNRSPFNLRTRLVTGKSLGRSIQCVWLRLFACLWLLIVYYLVALTLSHSVVNSPFLEWTNVAGPTALLLMTFWAAYSIIRLHPMAIWTPSVLYLLSTGMFFGFGPLVYVFGNDATIYYLSHNIVTNLSVFDLSRTNLLNAVGTISVVTVIYVMMGFISTEIEPIHPSTLLRAPYFSLARTAVFFLVVGGILRFFVILPSDFGMTDFVVPGVINNLGNLTDLGLTITAYMAKRRKAHWQATLWIVWPLHFLTVILQFKKSILVIALLLPVLGSYIADGKLKKLAIWVVAISVIYNFSQPFVHYGRDIIQAETGSIHHATLLERFDITKQYLSEGIFLERENAPSTTKNVKDAAYQSGWTRLAYAGPQSFAMREYDAGRPGSTLHNAWIVLIPRMFWPEKPAGIGPGRIFYEAVTGHERPAYLGLSIYGDGYWQWGWGGVIVLSGLMGAIFSVMSKFTLTWLSQGKMIFLPVIFMSMQMALLGTTGFFINKILGALPIYFAYIIAVNCFLMMMPSRIKRVG